MADVYTKITAVLSEPVTAQLMVQLPDGKVRACTTEDLKAFKLLFEDDVRSRYYQFTDWVQAMLGTNQWDGDALSVLMAAVQWFVYSGAGPSMIPDDVEDEHRSKLAIGLLNAVKLP